MKKENIPNALTLIRVVMIPIFIAIILVNLPIQWQINYWSCQPLS